MMNRHPTPSLFRSKRNLILLLVGVCFILFLFYTRGPSPSSSPSTFSSSPSTSSSSTTIPSLPSIQRPKRRQVNSKVGVTKDDPATIAESKLLMELGLRKFKLSNRVFYFFERQEKDDCKTLMGPYPLIVVLHGMGGSALEYAQNRTKWLDFAKKECFSVVFPQALPSPFRDNVTVWGGQGHSSLPTQHIRKVEGDDVTNANRKKEGETEEGSTGDGNKKGKGEEDIDHEHLEEDADWDDAVFLQQMLDSLIDGFPSSIDRNSVFAVGISNGGFFLCDALGPSRMATLFSGVCLMVSGCSMTTPTEARIDMEKSKVPSIPVLLIVGSLDSHHYRFGRRAEEVFKSAGFEDTTLIQVRRGHEYYSDLERVIMRYFRNTNIQDVLPTIRDLEDTPVFRSNKKL